MNNEPLHSFLSEKNVLLHREFLKTERAKYSILEKCFPRIAGLGFSEIYSMRSLGRRDKEEILTLLAGIKLHELYFSSFASNPLPCEWIKNYYSSPDAYLYEGLLLGKGKPYGFLAFFNDRYGKPQVTYTECGIDILLRCAPILAIDLCEHSYFLDYGFESEEYLRRALGFLDISRLGGKS